MVDHQLLRAVKDELANLKRENRDLERENHHLWKIIGLLNDLQCEMEDLYSSSDVLNQVMKILEIALQAVGSQNGSVMLFDEEKDQLVFVAVIGERSAELTGYRIPADAGIAGWTARQKQPTLVKDVRKDGRWLSDVDQSIGFHTGCLMAVPLVLGDRILGVVEVVNSIQEETFQETDLELLQLVARLSSFVIGCLEEALRSQSSRRLWKNLN